MKQRKGLGMGVFDGLQDKLEENLAVTDIRNIDIKLLVPAKENFYKLDKMDELTDDIKEHGLYHNLLVKEIEEGKYKIISGHRRYKSLLELNFTEVPCKIVDKNINDLDVEIMMIKANSTGRELNDDTKRIQINRLEELYKAKKRSGEDVRGKLRDKIGNDLGLSGSQVQKYMQLNKKLIPKLQKLLDNKEITFTNAFDYTKFDEEQQKNIYELLITNLGDKKTVIQNLNNELSKKSNEIKSMAAVNQELNNKIEELNNDIALKDEKLSSIDTDIQKIKQQIEEETKNQSKWELISLKNKLNKLENGKIKLEQEKEELEIELTTANGFNIKKEKADKRSEIDLNLELVAKNIEELTKKLFLTLQQKNYIPSESTKRVLQLLKENEIKLLSEIIEKTKKGII